LPLALCQPDRLSGCRTFFAAERLSPSSRERVRVAVFEWEFEEDDIIRVEWEDFEVEGEITPSKEGDFFDWEVADQYVVRNGRWVDTYVPVEGKYAAWWGRGHVEIISADSPEQARQIFLARIIQTCANKEASGCV
jgi:hypothetical protein